MIDRLYIDVICKALSLRSEQVCNTIDLLDDGATIPFISRYRKEATGSLDEVAVGAIKRYYDDFVALDKRKETVLKTISEAGALTDEIKKAISRAVKLSVLEDIYLPFRPKKGTRAAMAREKGLEPLAKAMYSGSVHSVRELEKMKPSAVSSEDALKGAKDIVAEYFSEDPDFRDAVRAIYKTLCINTKVKDKAHPEASNYKQFFSSREHFSRMPAYRVLAMLRAENEGIISYKFDIEPEKCCRKLYYEYGHKYRYPSKELEPIMQDALLDSFKRLIEPSISNEVIAEAKKRADKESIAVFGENLRSLLLQAPLLGKAVLALDPGFRTGCKTVCINAFGDLLCHDVIYPHPPQNEKVLSIQKISSLVEKYSIDAIAIGSGTASRETAAFIAKVPFSRDVEVYVVSEDGASIYSASDVAREEFPDYDLTVRGAVSIGRRLQDPLSELVKIDPKSLGVGQYQHDVDQNLLKAELDLTVQSCVNSVGVNLNTASPYLLQYVSGLGPALARKVYEYRVANGPFASRTDLLKVPRLGQKAYQQCAGFLRIKDGTNALDNSAVHPEAYYIVDKMAASLGVKASSLIGNQTALDSLDPAAFVDSSFGLPTVTDIISELRKPGLDPRGKASSFSFDEGVHTIEDLREGMELPGIITNITAFGAFVDLGIKTNGLIHSSAFPTGKNIHLRDTVRVRVNSIDLERGRIGLGFAGIIK